MTVLSKILAWSISRPSWQRNALRRIVIQESISSHDIEALAETCKSQHGLSQCGDAIPFSETDLPSAPQHAAVYLTSLTHVSGVNALAKGLTLNFGSALTVIYGANAAGKSGYTRILKRICRARGAEKILDNCLVGRSGRPASRYFNHRRRCCGDVKLVR